MLIAAQIYGPKLTTAIYRIPISFRFKMKSQTELRQQSLIIMEYLFDRWWQLWKGSPRNSYRQLNTYFSTSATLRKRHQRNMRKSGLLWRKRSKKYRKMRISGPACRSFTIMKICSVSTYYQTRSIDV